MPSIGMGGPPRVALSFLGRCRVLSYPLQDVTKAERCLEYRATVALSPRPPRCTRVEGVRRDTTRGNGCDDLAEPFPALPGPIQSAIPREVGRIVRLGRVL